MKNLLQIPLGIEIETALVDKTNFAVFPIAHKVLETTAKQPATDFTDGYITWSNELVNHVIEFKVSKPEILSEYMANQFHKSMQRCAKVVTDHNGRMLPTAMHPFMLPETQTQIWPGVYNEHYMAYHNIFNCFKHGFANLQSVHINIPFSNENEFSRILAAIRIVLPLIPALAASSPIKESKITHSLDTRLEVYANNQKKVASVTGMIIPEQIFTIAEYTEQILEKMYQDIAPYDTTGMLHNEQLNSRGCIARFDRNTFEIRLIDAQECPMADIAIASAVMYIVNELFHERWLSYEQQKQVDTGILYDLLMQTINTAEHTLISNREYLLQFEQNTPITAQELLQIILSPFIFEREKSGSQFAEILKINLDTGPLARRIISKLPENPTEAEIKKVYQQLADCFTQNTLFQ